MKKKPVENTQLTRRQAEFVRQYMLDMCAKTAAVRAGYSRRTAEQIGHQLLQKTSVGAAIAQATELRSARLEMHADDVVRGLIQDVTADLAEIFWHDGTLKPVALWPYHWRSRGLVESFEVEERQVNGGRNRGYSIRLVRIRFADRLRRLELLGRHFGAFQTSISALNVERRGGPAPGAIETKITMSRG